MIPAGRGCALLDPFSYELEFNGSVGKHDEADDHGRADGGYDNAGDHGDFILST